MLEGEERAEAEGEGLCFGGEDLAERGDSCVGGVGGRVDC